MLDGADSESGVHVEPELSRDELGLMTLDAIARLQTALLDLPEFREVAPDDFFELGDRKGNPEDVKRAVFTVNGKEHKVEFDGFREARGMYADYPRPEQKITITTPTDWLSLAIQTTELDSDESQIDFADARLMGTVGSHHNTQSTFTQIPVSFPELHMTA